MQAVTLTPIPRHPSLRRTIQVFIGLAILGTVLVAQRSGRPDAPIGTETPVSYEAVVLPAAASDSFIVDIHYRIPAAFFVFLRTSEGQSSGQGELLVELAGTNGAQTRREVRPLRIDRVRDPAPGEDVPDLQSSVRFFVGPGTYTIVFEVKAFDAERSFLDRRRTLEIASGTGLTAVPRMLFGYPSNDGDGFVPFNRGGAALFGSRGGMVLHLRAPSHDPIIVEWHITAPDRDDGGRPVDLRARDTIMSRRTMTTPEEGSQVRYRFDGVASGIWTSAFLPLPLEQLEPGPYVVDVNLSSGVDRFHQVYRFAVIWPSQPRSLANFDVAVDALRHIADPEEVDEMVGFFADGGRSRFDEFWRLRDPDTTTAYNPVQEEYYRRVDEAIRRFSTREGTDGYKTDRGRILILFGTPTSSQRIFRPNTGPREIWIYEQQRKRFIFTDPSRTGDYQLTQTEDL